MPLGSSATCGLRQRAAFQVGSQSGGSPAGRWETLQGSLREENLRAGIRRGGKPSEKVLQHFAGVLQNIPKYIKTNSCEKLNRFERNAGYFKMLQNISKYFIGSSECFKTLHRYFRMLQSVALVFCYDLSMITFPVGGMGGHRDSLQLSSARLGPGELRWRPRSRNVRRRLSTG